MTNFNYEEVRGYSKVEALVGLRQNVADDLRVIVIGIVLHHHDHAFAERFCVELADHESDNVRGNAILGFGHLARRFGELNIAIVKPVIEAALVDKSEYVRGQAWAAADDITHFLGCTIDGFDGS